MAEKVQLKKTLVVRVTDDDVKTLDKLAEAIPVASKNAIAREAMRIGMEVLLNDPTKIVARKRK